MSVQKATRHVIDTLSASKLTGALPALDGSALTNVGDIVLKSVVDPATNSNPASGVGTLWINTSSGEMFSCTDATAGENVWTNIGGGSSANIEPFGGTLNAYFSGGYEPPSAGSKKMIDKVSFASDANATDHGDLNVLRAHHSGQSSATHGYSCAGYNPTTLSSTEKWTFASSASATNLGSLGASNYGGCGHQNETNGWHSLGYIGSGSFYNGIDRIDFSSDGITTGVGNMGSRGNAEDVHGISSRTDGYVSGGASVTKISRFSFASEGALAHVGSLTTHRGGAAGGQSATHGYSVGGIGTPSYVAMNSIDKFLFASSADASDIADLTVAKRAITGASSVSYGYVSGGIPEYTVIDKYSTSSDANATDVGDMTTGRYAPAGHQV